MNCTGRNWDHFKNWTWESTGRGGELCKAEKYRTRTSLHGNQKVLQLQYNVKSITRINDIIECLKGLQKRKLVSLTRCSCLSRHFMCMTTSRVN